MENNYIDIINKTKNVSKDKIVKNMDNIIDAYIDAINLNKELINRTIAIDINENNGIPIDFKTISNIFKKVKQESIRYGKILTQEKDIKNGLIYAKTIYDKGLVVAITDGNPYLTIELILRNLIAGNSFLFVNNGYMQGTNTFLIEIFKTILEKYDISKDLVNTILTENYEEVLKYYSSINLVLAIGDSSLQQKVLSLTKNPIITSGYLHYNLYIEDIKHLDFINKILNTYYDITLYVKNDVNYNFKNAISVLDVYEAITLINASSNLYSASIFTSDDTTARTFIKDIHTKKVMVNASPLLESYLDIKEEDLVDIKEIYSAYSNN